MAELIYLRPGQQMPDFGDEVPWLDIYATDDGRFFGTGWARKTTGDGITYISLPEDDVSLENASEAAQNWAAKYGVRRIWVQTTPS